MKSLRFDRFGPPEDVLSLVNRERRALRDGEVRLRILASPINPADRNFIEGTYGVKPELPAVPGTEACGEVIESRDDSFPDGTRAIFLGRAELWAEEAVVPGRELLAVPGDLDPLQAAMLKVNPATAWRLLHGFRRIPAGGCVIQNAANSGVGRCVIQVARSLGIRTINLVRRPELFDELRSLGADEVLVDGPDAVEQVKGLDGDRPALALNAVGGDSALRLMNCLAPGGAHITYGAMARRPLKVPNGMLIFKDLEIRGLWVTRWISSAPRDELEEAYARLTTIRPRVPVDSTFPLERWAEALARDADPAREGKVLLVPG